MLAFRINAARAQPIVDRIDRPDPAAGEIRIAVSACGLNFADLLIAEGTYQDLPDFPATLGMEVSGRVESLGAGVAGLARGDRVAAFPGHGGLAEYAIAPAERVVKLPDTLPDIDAAGFMIAYGTSHLALTERARLQSGETLVVLGAAGGVGRTAVEVGAALGARVIAVARGADKLETARAAGAHHVFDSDTVDLRQTLRDLGGVDVIYDPVGGAAMQAALRATRPLARALVIGFASGEVPRLAPNHLMVKNVDILGFYWGGYLRFAPERLTRSLDELIAWHAEGRLHPHVSHVLPLERAAEGLDLLRRRAAAGKVVVAVNAAVPEPASRRPADPQAS